MAYLIIGIVLFIGTHCIPAVPAFRATLVSRLGEPGYKGVFSLMALAGLTLMVVGKAWAPHIDVWSPPTFTRHVAMLLMLPVFMLLAASHMRSNIKRFTAHPMLWGITLWSLAHLIANGDLASMLLFGSLGAFALLDMWSANSRGAQTSSTRYPLSRDAGVVAAGVVVYTVLLYLHPVLFRMPLFY